MKKITVKGRQFAYEVIGAGSPTVVLETGIGAESSEWGPVATAIARSRAVFRYDRAGRGESDPGQRNRDALTMASELNALLEVTQTEVPYILVGHSFGGLVMRLFANAKSTYIWTGPGGVDPSSSVSGAGFCISSSEMIFLAVPFSAHRDVARQRERWNGKIIVDTMNTLHTRPEELRGRLSSELVSEVFVGARLVKAFNHLPAEQFGVSSSLPSQRLAIFLSSNDIDASTTVAALVTELGFAPVELGRLDQGGVPLHVVGGRPGGLLFQNLANYG